MFIARSRCTKEVTHPLDHLALLADDLDGDVGGADLLRDPPSLPVLHVRPTKLVQDLKRDKNLVNLMLAAKIIT